MSAFDASAAGCGGKPFGWVRLVAAEARRRIRKITLGADHHGLVCVGVLLSERVDSASEISLHSLQLLTRHEDASIFRHCTWEANILSFFL